jgi:aspartate-semialdehyde dehydrogenase
MKKMKIGILAGTGMVGQKYIQLLKENNLGHLSSRLTCPRIIQIFLKPDI